MKKLFQCISSYALNSVENYIGFYTCFSFIFRDHFSETFVKNYSANSELNVSIGKNAKNILLQSGNVVVFVDQKMLNLVLLESV